MSPDKMLLTVRPVSARVSIIDVQGDMGGCAEQALQDAYSRAAEQNAAVVILNFSGLDYLNARSISLLIRLLIQSRRQQRRLLAYTLSSHYRYLLYLTHLDQYIGISETEAEALDAAHALWATTEP